MDTETYKYSPFGIKNPDLFKWVYAEFVEWCKSNYTHGTFSTYMDGEPYFIVDGVVINFRA